MHTVPLIVRPADPREPAVRTLIAELDEYHTRLYPAASNHLDPPETLASPNVHFVTATLDARLAGCGALKCFDGWGEIKRMYVRPHARGHGVARAILVALEKAARDRGIEVLRLETGVRNDDALAFYRKAGFQEVPAFAPYAADPFSVFMEKRTESARR